MYDGTVKNDSLLEKRTRRYYFDDSDQVLDTYESIIVIISFHMCFLIIHHKQWLLNLNYSVSISVILILFIPICFLVLSFVFKYI